MIILPLVLSMAGSFLAAWVLIPRLLHAGIVGKDIQKRAQPSIPEMGGIAIVLGFTAGVLIAVGTVSFVHSFSFVSLAALLAALGAVLIAGLIGLIDDLLRIHQGVKALLPILAAVPLMAIRAGQTRMLIPALGHVDLWILYPLVGIPFAVTVATNATNMLAGFNGLEIGLGIVVMGSLSIIAWQLSETTALILLLSGLGALLGMLQFNWYPARVFVGDVGTLTIGAIIAAAVIIGDFEVAGLILLVPYGIDFLFKAFHRFPSTGWGGELRADGKLHCPQHGPVSLCQFIMRITGGIHERSLVLLLMGVETVLGLAAIGLYVFR